MINLKEFVKKIFSKKEIPGDPLDTTPGLKISRTLNESGNLSFNEIAQNILVQKKLLK